MALRHTYLLLLAGAAAALVAAELLGLGPEDAAGLLGTGKENKQTKEKVILLLLELGNITPRLCSSVLLLTCSFGSGGFGSCSRLSGSVNGG